MIIYMATNRINYKEYIGQTISNLQRRKNQHIQNSLSKKDNTYFHAAIRKYGSNNFDWEILHDNITNMNDLKKLEMFYIELYDTFNNGYNLTKGGEGTVGWNHSEETKKKISIAHFGKILSESHIQKLRIINTGKNNSMYGKRKEETGMYGKKHTEKSKIKMAKSQIGNYHTEKTKKKISETKKGTFTGKDSPLAKAVIINNKYFNTVNEAAKFIDVNRHTISRRIKRQKPGYHYAM